MPKGKVHTSLNMHMYAICTRRGDATLCVVLVIIIIIVIIYIYIYISSSSSSSSSSIISSSSSSCHHRMGSLVIIIKNVNSS